MEEGKSEAQAVEDGDEGEAKDVPAPRVGRLLLYSLGDVPVETQRIDMAAILDAKWAPELRQGVPELAVADAKGGLARYALRDGTLNVVERLEVADEDTLVLSLDHRPSLASDDAGSSAGSPEIMVSLSSGELAHIVTRESGMEVASRWAAHDFEPWITAWGRQPDTLWSGGDDLALKRWDVRMPGTPTFAKRRGFDGGVTTIAPSPHDEHLLAVGS